MTIEYLDSKRIVGTSTEGKSTVTFEDDFTTNKGWTTTDASKYSVNTCGWIDFDPSSDQTDNRISIDIGTTLSDTAWVMRWKQEITTFVQGSAGQHLSLDIGIADREVNGATAIGIIKAHHASNVSVNYTNISGYPVTCGTEYDSYGSTPSYPNGHVCGFTPSAKTNWVEMKRTGATSASLAFYTCSSFATLDGSVKEVTIGNPTGLRYVMLGSEYAGQIAGTARYTGKFSELKIYDGVTSVVEETQRPTEVEDNTLWLEKDTANRYWFSSETDNLIFEDDFSSSACWTLGQMSISSNKLSGTVASSGDMTYLDLTSTDIPDDKWTLRFGLKITGTNTSSLNALFIGLADSTAIGSSVFAAGDHLGTIVYTSDVEPYNLRAVNCGSSVDFVRSSTTPVTSTQYYVEVIKDGANSSVRFYDSSDFTDSGSSLSLLQGSNAGSVNAFDYFMVKPYNTGSGSHTIEITDLKIYNNITTVTPATWTMQPTRFDLSTSTGWTTTGSTSSVDTTGEYLEGSSTVNDDRATKALGITLDDTKFVIRQKMELVTVTSGGSYGQLYFGYTDKDNSTTVLGCRDGIGITIRTTPDMLQSHADCQAWQSTATLSTTPASSTTYYLELIRNSSTSITLNLYSDSDYSVLVETATNTIASTITGLNHITIGGWDNSSSGVITVRISNIEIYNGVNSIN